MVWQSIETAPRDGTVIILNIGLPWAVCGVWCKPSDAWCCAELQSDAYNGKWDDNYFQNEYERTPTGWQPMPAIGE